MTAALQTQTPIRRTACGGRIMGGTAAHPRAATAALGPDPASDVPTLIHTAVTTVVNKVIFMRTTLVCGLTGLMVLAGCGGSTSHSDDIDHITACQEQSDLARLGKVPTGDIAISCPEHGIGDYR